MLHGVAWLLSVAWQRRRALGYALDVVEHGAALKERYCVAWLGGELKYRMQTVFELWVLPLTQAAKQNR